MRTWLERYQLLALGLLGGAAYLAWVLRWVVVVLLLGYILAAALRPAVDWLERLKVPRVLGILLLYASFFAALGGIIAPAAGPLAEQAQSLAAKLGSLTQELAAGVPFIGADQIGNFFEYVQNQALSATALSLALIAGLASAVIVSVYLLYDWHEIHGALRAKGGRWRAALAAAVSDSEAALGAWVRGQLLLSAAVGMLALVALVALGVDFAPVLAALAFLFEFVPYAGPFLAGAPAVLVALNSSSTTALLVIAAYVVIQQLENHVLVPLVMKHSVNIHPVVAIGVMLAGFEILGIPGVLLAVPAALLVRISVVHFLHA